MSEDAQMKLRLPPELKDQIEERARDNKRTMNGEIVHIIENAITSESAQYFSWQRFSSMSEANCVDQLNQYLRENPEAKVQSVSIVNTGKIFSLYVFIRAKRPKRLL
ncbi:MULTISPECIES: Arc family DNA-binding protein [unclassified Acinetobacter]|uniref:Arc family DNA-binding protein n=1 Tax=unclassified Acinetobacter TaxID=196816 RepID=UPI00244B422E|nr:MULTISPECIES: Arc family DNA-binding protein [unclassified Acinetobacter]MDH0032007.1 Arc family DNA-binding protein [Acinetobacter sp. GD04021]MDH0887663.1 Arc family DNA-binding protein [Acinetobacter sp. GD03873]MDH1084011.1 Arc family DNA-binding protein [Acinetobacter sp. GD03983]MDH2191062.1 Arc family DNA-binding protein [Acinetobacter sp. GD03645]MDH2204523.1 Arc family DNA-binding protein [Acinetobacter sp. GD03647]